MARWPMAALLASVAPIGRHQSDVRGMPPAWNRSAAADLMVGSGEGAGSASGGYPRKTLQVLPRANTAKF